jgi:molybdate transport system ATP-binding protein
MNIAPVDDPELRVDFSRTYRQGPTIRATLSVPLNRFSVTALMGPSGCGKTTILRCLAGLDRPQSGQIHFGNVCWFNAAQRIQQTPQQRGVGLLFQEYALFPHLTARENVAYGISRSVRRTQPARIQELFALLQLEGLESRYPRQLSGGQQQRVALARAVATSPRLLLLDEPLAALDSATRANLREDLRRLLAAWGIPTILVSHDRDDVISLAHEVLILDQGEIVRRGAPEGIFSSQSG